MLLCVCERQRPLAKQGWGPIAQPLYLDTMLQPRYDTEEAPKAFQRDAHKPSLRGKGVSAGKEWVKSMMKGQQV